jgi:hypothetical protein
LSGKEWIIPVYKNNPENFLKNSLTLFVKISYDFTLNGYSLIPSWWRDRPNETQQPAKEENDPAETSQDIFRAKVLN